MVEAFRTGDAPPPLSWDPEGRVEFNRALFLDLMGTEWLPAIPDLDRRLDAEPPARVADVACGTGWSSIAMATAYPKRSWSPTNAWARSSRPQRRWSSAMPTAGA